MHLTQHLRFVGGDHVLDVDEGVLAPVDLEQLQCLVDQVAHVAALLLRVIDLVTDVHCKTTTQMSKKSKQTRTMMPLSQRRA